MNPTKPVVIERELAGRRLSLETGRIAKQAAGSVMVRYGESVVLVAVVERVVREGMDFFPLMVDYRERGAAVGQIWGGRFFKREGRPTEKEIITCRVIDRAVRPLFPDGYMRDVIIQCIILSADPEVDPDVCAMIGASAALSVSPLPWLGPTGSVRVGYVDGQYVINPTYDQRESGDLDLAMSAKKDALVMVEAGANEQSEETMIGALAAGQEACRTICEMIDEMVEQVQPVKYEYEPPDTQLADELATKYFERAIEATRTPTKEGRRDALRALRDVIIQERVPEAETEGASDNKEKVKAIKDAFETLQTRAIRKLILDGTRCDGRALDEVRAISSEVTLLPRTHGSALFTRGETQALVSLTLGTPDDEQLVESLHGEYSMRFLLHYNFPSFCVGEVRVPRGPGRREIGHGNLARRAMMPVLPEYDSFPYTIRVISDIMESNGSSSMATVCGTTLAMMDAGVPIKDPVAGIAMGLVEEGNEVRILSDILGDEDHCGDMDFKVAGTQHGITALQMDIKITGLTSEILKKALEQARVGRILILKGMLETLSAPRADVPTHAPKILKIKIDPKLIGKIIGPGGKVIRAMEEETGARVHVEDDGMVTVSAASAPAAEAALARVAALVERPQIGKIYEGEVKSIRDFGIFVEILPGTDGMVHISELDTAYVKSAQDVVKLGEKVRVKLTAIDDLGRIRLSRKAVLEEEAAK